MSTNLPLISVIIPTYNTARYITDAIESILEQNYINIEIIIIDDGSTDNTTEVLSPYTNRIIYKYQQNLGPAAARNLGLSIARGEIIGFLDADDLWSKDKIKKQLSHLQKFPDVEIVIGRHRLEYLSNAKEIADGAELHTEPQVSQGLPSALIRQTAFDKIGYFDTDLIYYEDWDWFLRAREMGVKMKVFDETVLIYRRHDSNMTHDIRRMSSYTFKMFQKSLRRRRENPNIQTKLPTITELEQKANL